MASNAPKHLNGDFHGTQSPASFFPVHGVRQIDHKLRELKQVADYLVINHHM
jgi:hypothetical protein